MNMFFNHLVRCIVLIALMLSSMVVQAAGTTTYIHTDLSGSPVAATDKTGVVRWRQSYRPYGDRLLQQDQGSHQQWFSGKSQDDTTGLAYSGARYYDPSLGRFMGIDSVRFSEANLHSFNRYAYANNNPYRYIDPDGRQAINVYPNFDPMEYLKEYALESVKFLAMASGGAGGAPLVARGVTIAAKVGTEGASGVLQTTSGAKYLGNSTGSSASGGAARAPMNPSVQEALNVVKNPSRSHGACCEIDAANKALNAGDSVRGANMGPVQLNNSGRILPACSTCREVMKFLGIE